MSQFSSEDACLRRLSESVQALAVQRVLSDRHGIADNIMGIYYRLRPIIVDYSMAIRESRDDDAKRIFEKVVGALESI